MKTKLDKTVKTVITDDILFTTEEVRKSIIVGIMQELLSRDHRDLLKQLHKQALNLIEGIPMEELRRMAAIKAKTTLSYGEETIPLLEQISTFRKNVNS